LHDNDGVIYGHYAGRWQVRPYIVTLLGWAKDYFDIRWLSYNSRREDVVKVIYSPSRIMGQYPKDRNHGLGKLDAILHEAGDRDWFIIEDERPCEEEIKHMQALNKLDRWIIVPESGADVLLDVKVVLEGWLKDKKIHVPFEWTRLDKGIDATLSTIAEWKGYKEDLAK